MKFNFFNLFLSIVALSFYSCEKKQLETIDFQIQEFDAVPIEKTHTQTVFMHYMPWFETDMSNNGSWGQHWTMANQDPNIVDSDGKRQIASHYYPMIGPYHSGSKEVIEYHLLLMKYAGVDALLIDWYGRFDVNDYKINLDNTNALIEMIEKVGLKFAIVYEDRTLNPVVNAGLAGSTENAAIQDMQYIEDNYFSKSSYYYVNDQPLLLVFGPTTLQSEANWNNIFSNLETQPAFLTYNGGVSVGSASLGEFAWVFDGNETLEQEYYQNLDDFILPMGSAYPGFHDFYLEGGVGPNFFYLPHNNGTTFQSKLDMVKNSGVDLVQLVTWNDYGEGTMIEPTFEFGFSFIEKVRSFNEVTTGSNTIFENIYDLHNKRVQNPNNIDIQKRLDQAFYYLVSLQVDEALEEIYN